MKQQLAQALRRLAARLLVIPFRVVAYLLHATGLERIYKPRFMRHAALLELTQEHLARLPKYSRTITGAQGDPMNLIFIARETDLKQVFREAGWHRANPASPFHVLYGLLMALLKRSYNTGPFAPLYVNIALQDLAYQQPARKGGFRQRHHLRIWRTGIILTSRKRVWVGAAGRESGMRLALAAPFWTHALDPDIDAERQHIVHSLENVGAVRLESVPMTGAVMASAPHKTVFGSEYFTDGRAEVVEV